MFARASKKKRFLIGAALLFAVVLIVPYLASRCLSPWRQIQVHHGTAEDVQPGSSDVVRVVAFNIAHGRGLASSNWDGGDQQERLVRLDAIADQLISLKPDMVILNEVDFDASWSNSVNQAAYLADKIGLPYRVEQRNLDLRLAFWTWRFGNAVLSRFPIRNPRLLDLPGYSGIETMLAGKKRGVICQVETPGQPLTVFAVHLSHRREQVRADSLQLMLELATAEQGPVVMAGDFNSTPPGFPFSTTDATGRNAIALLDESGVFQRFPIKGPVDAVNGTYPANQPDRIIDWIAVSHDLEVEGYHAAATSLSDHKPVIMDLSQPADAALGTEMKEE